MYVARHGETDWNRIGRYQGRLESHLTELGLRQAAALAKHVADMPPGERPGRIISSPLARCRETAEPTALALSLPIEIDERITEIDHGAWNGRLRDEIAADDPERFAAWRARPESVCFDGGETLGDVERRWRSFERDLAAASGNILVFTHDAVVRVAILTAMHRPLGEFWKVAAENGAFAEFERANGQLAIVRESVADHLGDSRAQIGKQAL